MNGGFLAVEVKRKKEETVSKPEVLGNIDSLLRAGRVDEPTLYPARVSLSNAA